MKHLFLSLFLLLVSSISAFAVQYPAISATLGDDAVISGDYVKMNGGSLTFSSVSASSAGTYDVTIRYKQNYGDKKEQNWVINGTNVGTVLFPQTTEWTDVVVVTSLISGNNTIAITKNWGWVDIQYIDVVPHQNISFDLNKNLVNPNANEAAKKMFAFMQENFQKKIISGVSAGDVLNGNNALTLDNVTEVKFIRNSSNNKTPAIVGLDFLHGTGQGFESGNTWNKNYTNATISLAKELYQRGGIPAYCWHWRDPRKTTNGFYASGKGSDDTDFDLTTACTNSNCTAWDTNSAAYKGIVADIDIVADYLKELQNAGVAILWRPLHEASGGWFWWGAKGAAPLKLLYKLVYDRLTTTHSLNNLIWVWNSDGADLDWYPGDNYADIIGRDFYWPDAETTINHSSLIGEFEKLKNLFGTNKMIALSENGSVPFPDNLKTDGAGWSYFMTWNGNYATQANPATDWNKIMNDSYVITLEDMPGWDTYTPPSDPDPILHSQFSILNSKSATYYSIKGEPLGNTKPQKAGVYIAKQGHSVKKIVVR